MADFAFIITKISNGIVVQNTGTKKKTYFKSLTDLARSEEGTQREPLLTENLELDGHKLRKALWLIKNNERISAVKELREIIQGRHTTLKSAVDTMRLLDNE